MKIQSAHSKNSQEIFEILETQREGLTEKEASERQTKYGLNALPEEKGYPFFKSLFNQINNLLTYVLLAAAIISYIFEHQVDVYVIIAVISINISIGMYHDFKAHKMVSSLKSALNIKCRVLRDSKLKEIPVEELVPGDIVDIRDGDKIPADLRIFEAKELSAIESSLTGESKSTRKETETLNNNIPLGDRKNMLYMGTYIVTGEAKGVVVATGLHTEIGKITKEIQNIEQEKTLFHKRIDKLTKQMVTIAGITVSITFIAGLIRGIETEELLLFAIASLVSGIPEGLPAVVTVVLSIASYRMSKRKAVLRNLPSIETLSTVTTIITDKTGTLTENTMTIKNILLPSKEEIEITGEGWQPKGDFFLNKEILNIGKREDITELLKWLSISSKGEIVKEKNKYEIIGDPTEASRTVLSLKGGFRKEDVFKNFVILDELPYDQEKKFRAILAEDKFKKERKIFIVGGGESVLNISNTKEKSYFLEQISSFADLGMRMQATAYKDVPRSTASLKGLELKDFTFTSVLCIQDPVRKDASDAVKKAQQAGVRIIMATGDHKNTALAVARETGIISTENGKGSKYPEAMNDDELASLSEEEFKDHVKNVSVFSRLTPLTKLKIARVLQEEGEIIAMTGDGVNDAPALKKADIGISMGIIGTDAAREASDMVLTDDNFASIVNAIEEGRTVFVNVRRTSLFLITTNIAEDIIIVISIISGFPLPLLPLQLLWLNLITDGLSDISLATEKSHKNILEKGPRKVTEGILSNEHFAFVSFNAVVMVILSLSTFIFFFNTSSLEEARTATFLVMAFTQLFNMFNMRSFNVSLFKLGVFSNRYVVGSFLLSTILLIMAVAFFPIANIFSFVTLKPGIFLLLFLMSSLVLWSAEIYKSVKSSYR